MNTKTRNTASLQPKELAAVYSISRIVAENLKLEQALAEIVRLARPVFIFDNAVLYLFNQESGQLEPAFARAIGRGRSSEADLAWGEVAAQEAFSSAKNFLHQPTLDPERDRLEQSFYLGIPLLVGGISIGALVLIRFGGPEFNPDQINLAEFIAAHVTQVIEHKRLVERIAKLEADRRLAKLQSDFIATVSHELKTPLGFIKGYATTLMRNDTTWDEAARREFLSVINEEADHLTELVNNLLDSSRLQAGILEIERKETDISSLIDENVERMRTRYPDFKIDWSPEASDHIIQVDPRRISQVMVNLISNAAKYAPGSTLKISTKDLGGDVQIRFRDNGPGITKEDLPNVFKRFYRAAESRKKVRGSGLGLYICRQIVRAHSGEIVVNSKKGQGTEFVITLPKQSIVEPIPAGRANG
ncbi:MAG: sensor histidine kinase [Anaerolineales bacterium]